MDYSRTIPHLLAELAAAYQHRRTLADSADEEHTLDDQLGLEQKMLSLLLDLLPVGVSILDGDRKVVFQNLALLKILDMNAEGIQTGAYQQRKYLAADGTPLGFDGFASVRAERSGQAVHNVETGILKENGDVIWVNVSAVPLDLPDWKMVIVTSDITERKRLDLSLRESEQRYTLLFQKSTIPAILLKLPEVTIADANEAAEALTGFTREEMLGRTAAELGIISQTQRSEAIRQFEHAGTLAENEKQIFNKAGEVRIVVSRTNPIELGGQQYAITTLEDVTERKRSEFNLQVAQERLNFALEKSNIGGWDLDLVDHTAFRTLGHDQLFGYTTLLPTWTYEMFLEHVLPEDRAHVDQKFQQATHAQTNWDFECRIRRTDGEVRWIRAAGGHELDENGQARRMAGIVQDITERKQAEQILINKEETLRQRTEELEQLLDFLPEAVWIAEDPECKVIHGNRFANDLLGTTKADNISQSAEAPAVVLRQFSQGRELAPDELPMQMAARTGRPQTDFELRIEHPSKPPRTLLGGAVPLFDASGKPRGAVASFHDITERKKAEERFMKSFRANPVGMNIIDLENGAITEVNDAYLTIFGVTREQVIGKTSVEAGLSEHQEERLRYLALLNEKGKLPQQEAEFRKPNGEVGHIIFSAEVIEIGDKRYGLVVSNDITERKHMEDELRRSNAELEQFAYVASHDLQEPLRAMAGMVQLLQQRYRGQLDERADQYIDLAVEASTRMQALINDLLTFSRVDRRGKPFEAVPLQTSVETALKNLAVAVQESRAQVTWEALPTVRADGGQMVQLFQNLIGNAIKFRGGKEPRIHIQARQVEDTWQVSVQDNGIGIEPQYFERIFQVFQRLHTRAEYPGTGIGLALCKKIVERHGGAIWVESTPGAGSTFHFTIPNRRKSDVSNPRP